MPGEKRDAILKAAMKIFAAKGFSQTTISDIAEEAGIGKGTVYEYFKSKDEILEEVFLFYIQQMESDILKYDESSSQMDKLNHLISSSIKSIMELEDLIVIVLDFWSSAFRDPSSRLYGMIKDLYDSFISIINDIVTKGQDTGEMNKSIDPEYFSMMLFSIIDEMFIHQVLGEKMDSEKFEFECKKIARLCLLGVAQPDFLKNQVVQ